jgi:hypothetical protein
MGSKHPAAIAGRLAPPAADVEQPTQGPVPGGATSLTEGSTRPGDTATYRSTLKD